MTKLSSHAKCFGKDEVGATAVEYGLMIGLITLSIIAAVRALGVGLNTFFTDLATEIQGF